MRYYPDSILDSQVQVIIHRLGMDHILNDRVRCIRSQGTKSRRTLARIHGLTKVFQMSMQTRPFYVIEILSENYDKLSKEEKIKTLIHELLHIPHSFGGGFRSHSPYVTRRTVDKAYKELFL